MQHVHLLEAIRQLVRRTFADLGTAGEFEVTERLLLREDMYCGRRFQAGGLQAIWFIEEDEIKFHAKDGSVVYVMSSSDAESLLEMEQRRAA
jgi:hypothetical protein